MQRGAAAGVARIGVRAIGDQAVDLGPVLGGGGGDMEELRPVTEPEPTVHAVGVDHFGRTQAFPLVWRPRPARFR